MSNVARRRSVLLVNVRQTFAIKRQCTDRQHHAAPPSSSSPPRGSQWPAESTCLATPK